MACCALSGFLRGRDSAVFPKLMCRIFSPPGQGLANYDPHTESILPPVSVNEVYWDVATPVPCIVCTWFCTQQQSCRLAAETWRPRDRMTGTTESIYYLALSRKSLPVPPLRNSWNWCSLGTLIGWVVLALVCDESA